jgi:hypothetical protein
MRELNDAAGRGGTYNARIEIANPILRSFMRVKEGLEVYHDIQVRTTQTLFVDIMPHPIFIMLFC